MAFQVFYKILFKSLRSGTVYTVNIYKDGTLPSGYPLTLKGAAQPFVTEEDNDEDMFMPIRTQSGYLNIVDDGYAEDANGNTVSFNWKELVPTIDTDRPVTLTHSSGDTSTGRVICSRRTLAARCMATRKSDPIPSTACCHPWQEPTSTTRRRNSRTLPIC